MDQTSASPQGLRDIYTVSRLNLEVRKLLEGSFPLIWLEAEISNLARPGSGHMYFSLKDEAAQVRCAMFRSRNLHLGFVPENGMQVLVRARIGLYEARGEFQLVIEHMEEAGDGALRRAFELLKQRLQAEGLFDPGRKRPLPALPKCIGVITSPSGAAIRDILSTLKRRFPAVPVIIYPVPVQGNAASSQIAAMLEQAGQRRDCDVLILARGGGSLEDLWPFNEEQLARAIADCPLPIITGIGHEIDFSIADFVADQRAPTPTAAAELASPDQMEWQQRFLQRQGQLQKLLDTRLRHQRQQLEWLSKRLQHPGRRLQEIAQRLDDLELRQRQALRHLTRHRSAQLLMLSERLQRHNPQQRLTHLSADNIGLARRLRNSLEYLLETKQRQLSLHSRALDAVSPLATLSRGYAIVTTEDGGIVRRADEVCLGDSIQARLHHGRLKCEVKGLSNDENE